MTCTDPALVVEHASKRFRGWRHAVQALDDVNLTVRPGDIMGLVGPNGAGKTTLLRAIAGLTGLEGGTVFVLGERAGSRAARHLLGYAPEAPTFPPALTVRDVLEYLARLHGRAPARRAAIARAIDIGQLSRVARRRAAHLSRGYAQRLALAAATLGEPSVLALDETLSGVDAVARRDLRERLRGLAGAGAAVLLATHDLSVLEQIASRVAVLHRGRVVREAPLAQLLGERVLDVVLDGTGGGAERVRGQLPGLRQSPAGFSLPLAPGQGPEEVLAVCRAHRLVVRASCIRLRSLEDVVLDTLEVS